MSLIGKLEILGKNSIIEFESQNRFPEGWLLFFDEEHSVNDENEHIIIKIQYSRERIRRLYQAGICHKDFEIKLFFAPFIDLIEELEHFDPDDIVKMNAYEIGPYQVNMAIEGIKNFTRMIEVLEKNKNTSVPFNNVLKTFNIHKSRLNKYEFNSTRHLLVEIFGDYGIDWYCWSDNLPPDLQSLLPLHLVIQLSPSSQTNHITPFHILKLYYNWFFDLFPSWNTIKYQESIENNDFLPIMTPHGFSTIRKKDFEEKKDIIVDGNQINYYEINIARNNYLKLWNEEDIIEHITDHPTFPTMPFLISTLTNIDILLDFLDMEPFSLYAAFRLKIILQSVSLQKNTSFDILDDDVKKNIQDHKMMIHIDKYFETYNFPTRPVNTERIIFKEVLHQESLKHIYRFTKNKRDRKRIIKLISDQDFIDKIRLDRSIQSNDN